MHFPLATDSANTTQPNSKSASSKPLLFVCKKTLPVFCTRKNTVNLHLRLLIQKEMVRVYDRMIWCVGIIVLILNNIIVYTKSSLYKNNSRLDAHYCDRSVLIKRRKTFVMSLLCFVCKPCQEVHCFSSCVWWALWGWGAHGLFPKHRHGTGAETRTSSKFGTQKSVPSLQIHKLPEICTRQQSWRLFLYPRRPNQSL